MSEKLKRYSREERFRGYIDQRIKTRVAEEPDFQERISGLEEVFEELLFWSGLRRTAVPSRQETVEEKIMKTKKAAAQQGMSNKEMSRVVLYGIQLAKSFYFWDMEQRRETRERHVYGMESGTSHPLGSRK